MHVVSVCLHFGKIIWLPWQRPLINWKKATGPSSARNALSYGVKIAKIGPVDPEILDQISPFLAGSAKVAERALYFTLPNFLLFSSFFIFFNDFSETNYLKIR